jgi:hypothetical protein
MDNIAYGTPEEKLKHAFSDAGPAMSLEVIYDLVACRMSNDGRFKPKCVVAGSYIKIKKKF